MDAGEAVAVGDGFRGAALNRAARLCSHAGAGEVLASDGVVHMAGTVEGVRFVQPESLRLKGLEQPLGVVRVVAGQPFRGGPLVVARASRGAALSAAPGVAWAGVAVLGWRRRVGRLPAAAQQRAARRFERPAQLAGDARLRRPDPVTPPRSAPRRRTPPWASTRCGSPTPTPTASRASTSETHLRQQTIQSATAPPAIAVGGGSVWVANSLDGTLSRIDPQTQRVVGEPAAGRQQPRLGRLCRRLVWVALAGEQRLVRIDPRSGTLVGS